MLSDMLIFGFVAVFISCGLLGAGFVKSKPGLVKCAIILEVMSALFVIIIGTAIIFAG